MPRDVLSEGGRWINFLYTIQLIILEESENRTHTKEAYEKGERGHAPGKIITQHASNMKEFF